MDDEDLLICAGMQVDTKTHIEKFNATRRRYSTKSLCFAPSLSLNFDQNGRVTACCFNRKHILGNYPLNSVKEIWNGEKIQELRNALAKNDLSLGCEQCDLMVREGNYESVLIKHFDDYHEFLDSTAKTNFFKLPFFSSARKKDLVPRVFEFELNNTCNLECIMCGGMWSSSIRKNREKLPKLESPYDSNFVQQIRPFLKGLRRANFLGGEPFLIKIYFELWDAIIEENDEIEVAITSNGTVLNSKVKQVIKDLKRCKITLSIDSLKKSTWTNIRRNGNFETMQENLSWLLKSGKLVSFSVCPIIQNWKEIPEIISFCEVKKLDIYFNVVYGPLGERIEGIHSNTDAAMEKESSLIPETSLQKLPQNQLKNVITFYRKFTFTKKYQTQLNALISQLEYWYSQKSK